MTAPLIVLSGPTGSGKTTVAQALAESLDLDCWTSKEGGLTDTAPVDRWRRWLRPDADPEEDGLADLDRANAMELLLALRRTDRPAVVESAALPLLLPPDNTALLVRLTANLRVRADRVGAVLPDLAPGEPNRIVDRKDFATQAKTRTCWALAADAVRACEWRSDLVVQCPDTTRCSDPKECAAITIDLIATAYQVYQRYLTQSATSATEAIRRLRELVHAHPRRLRRCSPLLTDPADRFSEWSWRRRLLIELDEERVREVAS